MKAAVRRYYDHSSALTLRRPWYREQVERYLLKAFWSDAASDITSKKLIARRQFCQATIRAHQAGILAGSDETLWLLRRQHIAVKPLLNDGASLKSGRVIMKLAGRARAVLALERTALNTLQRLSGIATATQTVVKQLPKEVAVAATRKTLWGALDKRAVSIGGGYSHRLGLFDGVLVKDNHLALVQHDRLRQVRWPQAVMALEVGSLLELKKAALHYPQFTSLLLDNFSPDRLRLAIHWLVKQHVRQRYVLEASGGITLDNCLAYGHTGVDVLSIGALTHSAPALNISLDITP